MSRQALRFDEGQKIPSGCTFISARLVGGNETEGLMAMGGNMKLSVSNFIREEDGITALEYGILAALVATALGVAFYPALKTLYDSLFASMTAAVSGAAKTSG